MKLHFRYKNLLFALAAVFLAACTQTTEQRNSSEKLEILATTGMIADAAQNIVGDKANVQALMGAGVDPHLYKATQGDLAKLQKADIVLYNGLHLEGKMAEIFEKISRQKTVVAAADGVVPEKFMRSAQFANNPDPHLWFDVAIWAQAVAHISKQIQAKDTANAAYYQQNTKKYLGELAHLDNSVRAQIATIPANSRVLVTAHDAFGYFGAAYKIEVRGLQGISTVSEFGLQDVTSLVNFICERKIKAVFVESSVPKRSIEAVIEGCRSKGHNVTIGGTLFSDAMGAAKTPEGTYIGMVQANVNTIVNALK
jgi:manganese/zinc/iron transport system substrate-binding protein